MATYLKLRKNIEYMMQSKGLWHDSLVDEIPRKWEKFGDTVLIDKEKYLKNPIWKQAGSDIWTCICESFNARRVALKGRIYPDGYRTPNCEVVWGDSTWVECQDNGIKYTWNITKSMFCAGNASERHRIATMNCKDEVVVDLYAGIGYFTLPYLVHAKARLVHACEWNPHAVEALKKNLLLNNVTDKCVVHPGDNQMAGLNDIADRVNCGLLPSSRCGWELACKALKSSVGGVLHLHENVVSGISIKNMDNVVPRGHVSSSSMENVSCKKASEKCEEQISYKEVNNLSEGDNSSKSIDNFVTADIHYKKMKNMLPLNDSCKNVDIENDSCSKIQNVVCGNGESCKNSENVITGYFDSCRNISSTMSGDYDSCKNIKSVMSGDCDCCKIDGDPKSGDDFCKNIRSSMPKENSSKKIDKVMYPDVHYKKEEWRLWSRDVSHEIQDILQRVKGANWEVRILQVHHVKSYAPHVDHLVLDLLCRPSVET